MGIDVYSHRAYGTTNFYIVGKQQVTRMLNRVAKIINGYIEYLGPKYRSLTNTKRHLYIDDDDANYIIVYRY
jgi:DNA integrity scanning protein DisA with diadenylate cyclase activity